MIENKQNNCVNKTSIASGNLRNKQNDPGKTYVKGKIGETRSM